MIVYHASNMEVRNPEIRQTRYAKDFGCGFYCTLNYAQAERWARRDRNLVPIVNHYAYENIPGLASKTFPEMTDEWLDFIADCRGGKAHAEELPR